MKIKKLNIFNAVKSAYKLAALEWKYLLQIGALPVGVHIVLSLFIHFNREEASSIESYLWHLPTTVVFCWFSFLVIRLSVFGEKLSNLSQDTIFLYRRKQSLKLTVIVAVLFNMAMMASAAILFTLTQSTLWSVNMPVTLGGLLLIGALFWSVRFGVFSILAAVGYPFKGFLKKVRGPVFSFQLVSIGIICLLPVLFVFQILISQIVQIPEIDAESFKLAPRQEVLLIMLSAPFALIINFLLNSAVAFALKESLGSD